ncbi:MAG: CehA/McbA family metallohydrolase, partial [Culicoidibacterales bacterium]
MKKTKYLAAALATTLTWSAMSPVLAVTTVHANSDETANLNESITSETTPEVETPETETPEVETLETETSETETPEATQASASLIFSEYVHGNNNDKALEITNVTEAPINLQDYRIAHIGFNSNREPRPIAGDSKSEADYTHQFADFVLEPGASYVLYHSGAKEELKAQIATISAPNVAVALGTNFMGFNGDDALFLMKGETVIDAVGSTTIPAKTTPYYKNTLIRQPEVLTGITEIANDEYNPVNELQWQITTGGEDFSTLGTHDYVSGEVTPDTEAPTITHTPVTAILKGESLTLTANVSDDRYVRSVEAFWREDGSETFTSAKMTSVDGEYTVSLPTQNALTTIEYYLIASDGVNEAKTETFSVEVDQTDVQGPVITSVTPKNKANLGETTTTNITINFSDDSAVNFAELSVNGEVIESSLSETTVEAVDVTIAEANTAIVTLRDEHGNETTYEWTFKASISTLEHYYGQIHAHSNLSDGYGTPEEAYTYANEVANLDFFALTDHSNWFDNDTQASLADGSASSEWQTGLAEADKANVPGEYTAIYGYEMTWSGSTGGYGHINTFNTPGFETRTNKAMNLPTYYDAIAEYGDSVSQLNHPGKTFGDFVDFGYYTAAADAVVNLVEVGNGEGPVHGTGYFPSYDYYTRALDKGWHVAPTNNQDNHKGNWGTSNTARTVVIAEENTRDGLYEAMQANRVYATEDSNLKIDYTLNGEVMGTQLAQTDTVNIKVAVTDPDGEAIGKVSIITDGGYVAATKYFDSSTATWEFELPAQFSYYYVRVDQPDKDVAVTAPVWVGEKENVGLSSVSVDNEKVIKGDTFEAKTTITNNSELPLTDLTVEWFVGSVEGEPVASTLVPVVEAGKMVDVKAEFLAEAVGTMTVYARVNLNGKYHTASKQISIVNVSDVTQVLVDGSKYNQYVTGNYAGKIENFKDLMSKRDVLVKVTQPATEITAEVLENMSVLIITDPEGTGDSTYGIEKANYSAEEIAVITQYIENGGNIIITTRADYKDASDEYSNSAQLNPILEAIGTSLRVNDDQVQDAVTNSGQTYRLSFNNFVEDPFGLTNGLSDKDNYTFYSGASVLVGDSATCLVKGHDTTESTNMDGADDHVVVEKGNVCALAAQELDNGAKVVVAGTTFFSDFEIADDVTANQLLTNNIMRWVAPEKEAPLISIANFRVHPEGIRFSVE